MSERLADELRAKITALRFTAAKFQYALVMEQGAWQIFAMRILFDYSNNFDKRETLIKEDNFILEDYTVSINDFYGFIESLKMVDVTNTQSKDSPIILAGYRLRFWGNYPGGTIHFLTSQQGKNHGLSRAFYYIQYYLHDSARSRNYDIAMTHHELPFRNAVEAINHYWDTRYDVSAILGQSIGFYLPLLDGSIRHCKRGGSKVSVELDLDRNRVSYGDLSVAVIAKSEDKEYRKKHSVPRDSVEIDIGFFPQSYSVTLNKGSLLLDEYNSSWEEVPSDPGRMQPPSYTMPSSSINTHIIYTDGSFREGKGFISWFSEATGEKHYASAPCKDSYRCEYQAVIHALENVKGYDEGDEIEIRCDIDPLVKQLNLENGINEDDIRQDAIRIWDIVARLYPGRVKFVWIPRANNKAGKIHGS